MKRVTICAAILLFFSGVFSVEAQFESQFIGPDGKIEFSPAYPQPGETVTATLNDYGIGAAGATIVWELDGQEITDARNTRETTFTAGAAGSETTVTAKLLLTQGGTQTLTETVRPLYLDVIVEPQTRTPHTYMGRALPSIGSSVNATAVLFDANGVVEGDYIYSWNLNRQVINGGPIRGNSQVSFEMPRGNSANLAVTISRPTGEIVAQRFVIVPVVKPELYFYEVHPLYGVQDRALRTSFNLVGNTTVLLAEPYYLDSRVFNNPDVNEWKIAREEVPTFGNPYEITIQKSGDSGTENVSFHVRSLSAVLQGVQGSLTVRY